MAEPGDRDERITALEADVAAMRSRLSRVEQDAAAARVLAGGADRDVRELGTEFRAFRAEMRDFRDQNNRVLSALRADLVDGFAQADRNFLTVHSKIDGIAAGLQLITELITRREGDERPPSP